MASENQIKKTIAGEVTLSDKPGQTLKKWREIFGISQTQQAKILKITPSVVSDYETGRRKNPGIKFIKKYIDGIILADKKSGGKLIKKFTPGKKPQAILDIKELLTPISAKKFIKKINGEVITGKQKIDKTRLHGYTVIDSLQAILDMTEKEFLGIYGTNTKRAVIFTKVNLGRSPMVAIKVTKPKPSLIILHGLTPEKVDKLAIHIAESIDVPLAVSNIEKPEEIIEILRKIT